MTPTIIANNWDRFGSRACPILIGYLLSKKLECRFSFEWPYDSRFDQMEKEVNFFSVRFQEKHRVYGIGSDRNLIFMNPKNHTLNEAKDLVSSMKSDVILKFEDFLTLPTFLGEEDKFVQIELRECALEIMDEQLAKQLSISKNLHSDAIAIHGRFGDLLNGDFSHFVPSDKYISSLTYRRFLEKSENIKKIVFLSDSIQVTNGLQRIVGRNLSPNRVTNSGIYLDDQWKDLFSLASSKTLIANTKSAFSVFASMIGNCLPLTIEKSPSDLTIFNLDDHYNNFDFNVRNSLKSRDIMNLIQLNFRELKFKRIFELNRIAYYSDPNYTMAACCQGIIEFLLGNPEMSHQIINMSEIESRKFVRIHNEPLALTLIVKYCLATLENPASANEIFTEIIKLELYQIPRNTIISFLDLWKNEIMMQSSSSQLNIKRLFFRFFILLHMGKNSKFNSIRFATQGVPTFADTHFLFMLLLLILKKFRD